MAPSLVAPMSAGAVGTPYDPYFAAPAVAADLGLSKAYGVAPGDFDGDGHGDLVICRSTVDTAGLSFASPTTIKDYGSTGRPFGIAAGDFDHDSIQDLIVRSSSTAGTFDFLKGVGDGTYAAAAALTGWRLEGANAFGVTAGDVNGDGWSDLVFGATVAGADAGAVIRVNDGEVRVLLNTQTGAAATMFSTNPYTRSGITFAAGTLMARIAVAGVDVGSVAAADVDGNGRDDIVAGGLDGAGNSVVKVISSNTDGTYTLGPAVVTQVVSPTTVQSPVYFPAINPATSPWGLAFTDMNSDGNRDLLVGDRGMYVYEYLGDGTGAFTMQTGFTAESGRPNALLSLSAAALRDALGSTPSLAAGDLNGDGRPDIVLGVNSGSQSAASGAHDGNVIASVSTGISSYTTPTVLADVDFEARGVTVIDANLDGANDIAWGSFAGKVSLLTQLAPVPPAPNVYFASGDGSAGFAAPTPMPWNLEAGNSVDLTSADVNQDGRLDLVYGSSTDGVGGGTLRVGNGDVRVLYGNGDGTFVTNGYTRAAGTYAAGSLLARVGSTGSTASSIAVGDIDGDDWPDVAVGGLSGANSVVQLIHNNADGTFSLAAPIISQPTATTTEQTPVYYPVLNPGSTPWGLAFGDADADGDQDLWVGDRALYVYHYKNNGSGAFTLKTGNSGLPAGRSNAYIDHDSYRASVGYTPSLASADLNGDGKADLVVGLQSGTNTPADGIAHDGELVLDVSAGTVHTTAGMLADIGTGARGVSMYDVNADGNTDIVTGDYAGKITLLRQLPPLDTDGDGISDYVDNAPAIANRPRIDMNTDGSYNAVDQLDNDFDTVRGDPENSATWQRLGDVADPDDDNDGDTDGSDNCLFTANADQADKDGDGVGDACDPLFDSDTDGDGVWAFDPADPMYARAQAAAAKWAEGDTHFVIRIDALGRFFQNEFTGLMSDAAISSPATWPAKCQGMYSTGDPDPGCTALAGGKEVPLTTVVIPRLLWTDPEVVTWINDRNDNPLFEVGQHGTYHNSDPSNTQLGDWAGDPNKGGISCDTCGLTEAESYELMKVGQDTLLGSYTNKWLVDSGATGASPKVDWTSSANPLISFAPPYNTSDTTAREAIAQLGYKAFSASVFEEGEPTTTTFSSYFTPEGSHHEEFDQFGMFHASADRQLDPIAVPDESYDQADRDDFAGELVAATQDGELNTWLIEEVEWSGRPCNESDRLGTCNGGSNRENNTVYAPRWEQWLQLLDYVKSYPGGVAMTMGEVALAQAFDNAPTVANADQADSDHDGVGDVIDGADIVAATANLSRNVAGTLSATLTNGSTPLAGQTVDFAFDADGNGTDEAYSGTTSSSGVATAAVTATRDIGSASFSVSWNGGTATASDTGTADIGDATTVTLDAANPTTGQVTDAVSVGATLTDSDDVAVAGRTLTFTIGSATDSGTTDANGHAQVSLALQGPAASSTLQVSFAGGGGLGSSSASHAFTIAKESTALGLAVTAGPKSTRIVAATLSEIDGLRLAGRTITFETTTKVRSHTAVEVMGSAVTDGQGVARFTVPSKYLSSTPRQVTARFAGDTSYLATSASTAVTR